MRARGKAGRPLTARELVDAVADAGLAGAGRADELRAFLAGLGYDPLEYLRARAALRRAGAL